MADLTIQQAAERLGVGRSTVNLWCRQGRFPNARVEETPLGSYWLIPERDLVGFEPPKMGRPPKSEAVAAKPTKAAKKPGAKPSPNGPAKAAKKKARGA
jgi:excisionase family DNA binding protein